MVREQDRGGARVVGRRHQRAVAGHARPGSESGTRLHAHAPSITPHAKPLRQSLDRVGITRAGFAKTVIHGRETHRPVPARGDRDGKHRERRGIRAPAGSHDDAFAASHGLECAMHLAGEGIARGPPQGSGPVGEGRLQRTHGFGAASAIADPSNADASIGTRSISA